MLRLGTSASDQGIDIADRAGELSCEGGAANDILVRCCSVAASRPFDSDSTAFEEF